MELAASTTRTTYDVVVDEVEIAVRNEMNDTDKLLDGYI